MGSETGGRKCDARSRLCARKRSVAAGADRVAYARWRRHGRSVPVNAHIDSAGKALIDPPERENLPDVCRACDQLETDKTVAIVNSPTYAWRYLGLVERDGTPTRRGMIFSFFHGGEGLAVAVALEDETYPIDELVFDLANIRAGPRFAGEDAPMGGRLGILCQRIYGRADYPGYLTMGVPVEYGAEASDDRPEPRSRRSPRRTPLQRQRCN